MRITIDHETVYRYDAPASYSIQYLRLTPLPGPSQRVIKWKLNSPGTLRPWRDAYGNAAHVLVIDQPHEAIRIQAVGEVELTASNVTPAGDDLLTPEMFLRETRLTELDDSLRGFADGFRPAIASNRRDGLEALMHDLRSEVEYQPGITHAATSAAEAWRHKAGVCQDHAHLFAACCRALGIPARYVSGYLCTEVVGEERMASHAWAEAWLDDVGWLSFDVANRLSATDAHVRVAVGLDYLDACPIRGMRRGGSGESMDVEVRVNERRERSRSGKAASQQQQQ